MAKRTEERKKKLHRLQSIVYRSWKLLAKKPNTLTERSKHHFHYDFVEWKVWSKDGANWKVHYLRFGEFLVNSCRSLLWKTVTTMSTKLESQMCSSRGMFKVMLAPSRKIYSEVHYQLCRVFFIGSLLENSFPWSIICSKSRKVWKMLFLSGRCRKATCINSIGK